MQTELAIIILNYKTPDLTVDCLTSLETEMRSGMQVIVVDNASGDGSAEKIERHIEKAGFGSWAQVLRWPINGGFAAGNNFGIRAVEATAYVLLNSDTIILPGAISGLLDAMRKRPDAGIIGPSFEGKEGAPEASAFRAPRPLTELVRAARTGVVDKLFARYRTYLQVGNEPREVEWVGFACVLIRREVVDRVGLLDEGFFMYFEDIDYCLEAKKAGYKTLFWPAPRVVHLLGASSHVTDESGAMRRPPRYFYEARSRYYAKHYGMRGLLLANAAWNAGRCIAWSREAVGTEKAAPSGR